MWRARTLKKGQYLLNAVRQFATESAPLPMPKPPPKSNVFRLLKIVGLGLPLAATSVLGYALYDQDFRTQLLDNIPYVKDLLQNILPESDEAPSAAIRIQKPEETHTYLDKVPTLTIEDVEKDATLQTVYSKKDTEGISDQLNEKKLCDGLAEPEIVHVNENEVLEHKPADELLINNADDSAFGKKDSNSQATQTISDNSDLVVEEQMKRREEDDKADNAELEAVINKIIANGQNLVAEAVKAQVDAASSIHNHSRLLKEVLDDVAYVSDKDMQWEALANAYKEREEAVLRASEHVSESIKCFEKLQDIIREGKASHVTQNNAAIQQASQQLNEFLRDLGNVNSQVREAETEASAIQKYKELVDKGRKQFQKEIESLVPAVKLSPDSKLSDDDLNTLIAHAYARIEQLQNQISELEAQERQKLRSAMEAQRQQDLKETELNIAEERQHLLEEFEAEKSKLEMEYLMSLDNEVTKQLSRQSAAHCDHLKDVLALQEQELNEEFRRALQLKILEQREKFQAEVVGWISRLRGIEAAIEARAANERLTRSAQNLWLACIALSSSIDFGPEDAQQSNPLRNQVEAVLKAGNENPFVHLMASSFPDAALDRGVKTEQELKSRFYRVSRICHRLGLVDTVNASIYKYLISYLHSLIVFDEVIESSETDEVDLNSLDTFALLAHAKYWIEKGNLDLAVRFMIQLHGESRRAASDWIKEVQLFLEAKQTAKILTTYASTSGLANTF